MWSRSGKLMTSLLICSLLVMFTDTGGEERVRVEVKGLDHMAIWIVSILACWGSKGSTYVYWNLFISLLKKNKQNFICLITALSVTMQQTECGKCVLAAVVQQRVGAGLFRRPRDNRLYSIVSFSSSVTGRVTHPPICVIKTSGSHLSSRMLSGVS